MLQYNKYTAKGRSSAVCFHCPYRKRLVNPHPNLGLANGCRLPQKTIIEILVGSLYWNIFLARRACQKAKLQP
jgi:hypothetical protein